MKRQLLPAVLGVVVLVAASGPLRSAGVAPAPAEEAPSPDLETRLAHAELLAGLVAVEGPGLTVTLRNSPRKPPRGLDKSNLLLHDRDVNAVLNALRAAGAEALAVAGAGSALPERVTHNTVVVGARGAFFVNGAELKPPLRLLAIGDAAVLRAELARKDGAVRGAGLDVLQMVEIADTSEVLVPAARHRLEFRYARKSSGEAPVEVATAPAAGSPAVNPVPSGSPAKPVAERVVAVKPREFPMPGRPSEKSERSPVTVAVPPEAGPGKPPVPVRGAELSPGKAATGEPVLSGPAVPQPRKEPVTLAVTPTSKRPALPAGVRPEAKAPVEAVSGPVFGGKGLAKYHKAGCRFGERIGRLERVTYVSPADARSHGRSPCQVCCGSG